jgi:hypothetical protein
VSGYREPSRKNRAAFEAAVEEVSRSSQHLLRALTSGPD